MDYVERQKAMSCVRGLTNVGYENIRNLPAADVRPVVRGEWEPSEKYKGYVSCSICHDCYVEPEWVTKLKWKFCPNCGADMRTKEEET